ncbi:hypothetical protein SDC9_161490 [bioreactor metagenome]|uniref:Uncharacterized protein n=1 Tax=bioreactor metagenome TaxID=1076179 RepID=A0A645FPJ8_9ZZZZ
MSAGESSRTRREDPASTNGMIEIMNFEFIFTSSFSRSLKTPKIQIPSTTAQVIVFTTLYPSSPFIGST